MMDQIISGMPQAQTPVHGPARDQQSGAQSANGQDGGTPADSFENYVSKAGNQQGNQQQGRAKSQQPDDDAADPKAAPQGVNLKTVSLSADAILGKQADDIVPDSRIKLAVLKPNQAQELAQKQALAQKLASALADAGKTAADPEKLLAKVQDAAKVLAQKADAIGSTVAATATQDEEVSAADELSMLLGLTPAKETTAKAAKKIDAANDADAGDDEDDKTVLGADSKSEISVAGDALTAAAVRAAEARNEKHDTKNNDEAVRVVSADGKGRAVDVPLVNPDADGVTEPDKRSNAVKFDTATVIEARRYLGFSTESNTTTLTNAIKADPGWTEAMSHVSRANLSLEGDTVKEVNTLKLQMNPGDLGNMVASLKLKGDELTVEVRVETIEAYRHLSNDQDGIVKALQDQGFSIDKVTVQLSAPERTEANSDRDLNRQNQNSRDAQSGQSNGRNDNNRQGNQNSWTRDEDAGTSTPADGRSDSSRSGNIYL